MNDEVKPNFKEKLKEILDYRLLSLESKLVKDILELNQFNKINVYSEEAKKNKNIILNKGSKIEIRVNNKMRKNNSISCLPDYKKLSNIETDITSETKNPSNSNYLNKTPLKKNLNKKFNFNFREEKFENYSKKTPIKGSELNLNKHSSRNSTKLYETQWNISTKHKNVSAIKYKQPLLSESKNKPTNNFVTKFSKPIEINKKVDPVLLSYFKDKIDKKNKSNTISFKYIKSNYLKSNAPLEDLFFNSKIEKAIAIFTLSSFLTLKTRIFINLYSKKLFNHFPKVKSLILQKSIFEYEKITYFIYSKIKHYIEDDNLRELISKPLSFCPSKTAQNALNFITLQNEISLLKCEQPSEVISLFKLIYVILKEDFSSLQDDKIIENLFYNIYKKYNVKRIKDLFIEVILRNMNFTEQQIVLLNKIVSENPKILISSDILKISKCANFFSFILKEIIDFASLKADDGVLVSNIRKVYMKYEEVKDKQIKLKKLF